MKKIFLANQVQKIYQTFWQRLGAAIIDSLVFLPITLFGSFIWGPHEDTSILWLSLYNTLYFSYSIIGHWKFGQTIGKKLLNVKVVQAANENHYLTFRQALYRDIVGIVFAFFQILFLYWNVSEFHPVQSVFSSVTFIWMIIDLTTMFFSSKRRSAHDYLADSVCIDVTKYSKWERNYGSHS